MLTKELVPTLADLWGVPQETAPTIDRSLADAGFRRKWKGPRPPHMTRREALSFLIACMVAERATRAGEEAAPWIRASTHYPLFDLSPDDSEYFEEAMETVRLGRAIDSMLEPSGSGGAPDHVLLTDFLLVVCHLIETGHIKSNRVAFVANLTQRSAALSFYSADALPGFKRLDEVTFKCGDHRAVEWRPTFISRDRKCEAPALAMEAIIERTADPLAPGATPETDWKGFVP